MSACGSDYWGSAHFWQTAMDSSWWQLTGGAMLKQQSKAIWRHKITTHTCMLTCHSIGIDHQQRYLSPKPLFRTVTAAHTYRWQHVCPERGGADVLHKVVCHLATCWTLQPVDDWLESNVRETKMRKVKNEHIIW